MSNAIFPTLPGLKFDNVRSPRFSTRTQTATSGKELTAAMWTYPVWDFKLSFEFLRESNGFTEMQTLAGFFLARMGSYDSFLFTDSTDNAVTAQPLGTGDGTTTTWTFVRTWASFIEPIGALNGLPQIYVNGVLKTSGTDYSIVGNSVIFVVAPGAALPITWSGSFYYRCRFKQDAAEFSQFLAQLWETKTIDLKSVK